MFNKKIAFLLIFILIFYIYVPVFASDSVYVWSDGIIDEAISTSALLR